MSFKGEISGDIAVKKFWKIAELVEKLLPYLDLDSIKNLAEFHELTQKIIGKAFVWKKLITRAFPENEKFNLSVGMMPLKDYAHFKDYAHLASDRRKAKVLAEILCLIKASPGSQPGMDLLHAICDRYPVPNPSFRLNGTWYHFVDVNCACLQQIHQVSRPGFVLLEDIQATLASREKSIVEVDKVHSDLSGPFLMALSSMTTRQEGMEMKIFPLAIFCHSRESAEAMANVAKWIQVDEGSGGPSEHVIFIGDEIGPEGWAAIRRVADHLADGLAGKNINLEWVEREAMVVEAEDHLKAIWAKVSSWNVVSECWKLEFTKEGDGEVCGWEGVVWGRKGIKDVISMTEEEWLEEAEKHGNYFDSEESESEESEAEG